MIGAAVRSRLFDLRRDRQAAQRSTELLDRKREALLREILQRERRRAQLRDSADASCRDARSKLDVARVEMGIDAIQAAALAQSAQLTIDERLGSVMGVRIVRLETHCNPFRADYGPAATTESLDAAGAAFLNALPFLVDLAQEENAIRKLRASMRKTTRILNALRKVVLPRIEQEIRITIEGIEEEERDEFTRREIRRRQPVTTIT